jgi:hypothetical protein
MLCSDDVHARDPATMLHSRVWPTASEMFQLRFVSLSPSSGASESIAHALLSACKSIAFFHYHFWGLVRHKYVTARLTFHTTSAKLTSKLSTGREGPLSLSHDQLPRGRDFNHQRWSMAFGCPYVG